MHESILFEAGAECNGIYILSKGSVDVWVRGIDHRFSKTVQLYKGSVLGEISFYLKTKRTATIVNSSYNKIFFLDK